MRPRLHRLLANGVSSASGPRLPAGDHRYGMDRKVARRGHGVLPPDGARNRPDRTVATCRPGLRIEQPFGRSGPSCRQRLRTGLADSVLMPVRVGLMTFRIRPTRLIECPLKSPLLPGKIDERYCILKDVFRIPGLSSLDFLAAGKKSHGRDT